MPMNCCSVDTVLYLTDSSCKITTLITNVNYLELEWCCWHYVYSWIKITTVFVDTWLWKTKHWRKHFQNFRRSCVLLTDQIEIHQLHVQPLVWPSNLLYIMLSGCDWWNSIQSVNNTQDGQKFWKCFRGCFLFQSRVSTKMVALCLKSWAFFV